MAHVKVRTNDGLLFKVEMDIAKRFTALKLTMGTMDESGDAGDPVIEEIPLANVDSDTLFKVLRWAHYHRNDPIDYNYADHSMSEWDLLYTDMDKVALVKLMNAALYLGIEGLAEMCGKSFAQYMADKNAAEKRGSGGSDGAAGGSDAEKAN